MGFLIERPNGSGLGPIRVEHLLWQRNPTKIAVHSALVHRGEYNCDDGLLKIKFEISNEKSPGGEAGLRHGLGFFGDHNGGVVTPFFDDPPESRSSKCKGQTCNESVAKEIGRAHV